MNMIRHVTACSRSVPVRFWMLPLFLWASLPVFGVVATNTNATASIAGNGLPQSVYSNANNRPDPFLPVKRKGSHSDTRLAVNESELHLKGILWHPTKPVAIVNHQPIALNETVTLKISSGDVTAKAISIERERVILKLSDRQIELQLER
jgi:hypothetical protein